MATTNTFSHLPAQDQRRLLDKLAKLKALAECPTGNAHETATAAATMAKIMLEYEIELAALDVSESPEDLQVLNQPLDDQELMTGFPTWQSSLATVLAEVHHCVFYLSVKAEYDFWGKHRRNTRHIIGTAQDIANVRRLFSFCVQEIERLAKVWGARQTMKLRNDFKTGAAGGVCHQVRQASDEVIQAEKQRSRQLPSRALERFEQKLDASRQLAADIGLSYRSSRSRSVSKDAYQAGYEAGSRLDLDNSKSRGKALPHPDARSSSAGGQQLLW